MGEVDMNPWIQRSTLVVLPLLAACGLLRQTSEVPADATVGLKALHPAKGSGIALVTDADGQPRVIDRPTARNMVRAAEAAASANAAASQTPAPAASVSPAAVAVAPPAPQSPPPSRTASPVAAAPVPASAGAVAVAPATPAPASRATPVAAAVTDLAVVHRDAILAAVEQWRAAWQRGDFKAYVAHYSPGFRGSEASREAWEKLRGTRLKARDIRIRLSQYEVAAREGQFAVRFRQDYQAASHKDAGMKELVLRTDLAGDYRIVSETWSVIR